LLPASLTGLGVSHVEEVVQSAVQLVHREMLSALDAPEAALLKDAALVFSTAAQRLAALAKQRGEKATKTS
jgi:predicted nucleic acid-binding protein